MQKIGRKAKSMKAKIELINITIIIGKEEDLFYECESRRSTTLFYSLKYFQMNPK